MVLVDHKQPRQTSSGVGVEEEEEEEEVGGHGLSSVYPPSPPLPLPSTFAVCRLSVGGGGGGGGRMRGEAQSAVEIPLKTFRGCSHSTLREHSERSPPSPLSLALPPSSSAPLSSSLLCHNCQTQILAA